MVEANDILAIKADGRFRILDLPKGDHRCPVGQEDGGIVRHLANLAETERALKERTCLGQIWNGQPDMMGALGLSLV